MLRVRDDVIVLQTMMWPDEIRQPDFYIEAGEVKPAEVKMANMLVETLAGDFDAAEFEDDYAGAVEALVKAKIEGGEVKRTETSTKSSGEVVDLLAALQRSVDAAKTARGEDSGSSGRLGWRAAKKPAKKAAAKKTTAKKTHGEEGHRQEGRTKKTAAKKTATKKAPEKGLLTAEVRVFACRSACSCAPKCRFLRGSGRAGDRGRRSPCGCGVREAPVHPREQRVRQSWRDQVDHLGHRACRVSTVTGRSSRARQIRSAVCSGVAAGRPAYASVGATIGVRTSESRMFVNVTLSAYASRPAIRENVSSAVFEAMYAANFGALTWTPQVTMLTTCPNRCARIAGSSPRVSRTGPKKLTAIVRSKSWNRS